MKNKMKTKKSLLKRIKVTATGKWIYKRAFTSHLALSKTQKQKRKLRKAAIMDKTNQTQLKRGLPYAKKTKKNLANCSKPNIVHNRGRKIFVAKNVQESKPSNESKSKE